MITINGKKMGKSYNNVIKLTELFSGNHPLLTQPFSPMTVRFFILQSHYRSTLDFSSEALVASEKAFKRLWEAYENLKLLPVDEESKIAKDADLDAKVLRWLQELEDFINDDFNTAKVLANLFEMAPIINSIKDKLIAADALSSGTLQLMKEKFSIFIEDILGLQEVAVEDKEILKSAMQLLIDIRKEAKDKKDFVTSDMIRNRLTEIGVNLKDEKDGKMSWTL
jgi:cysteinyl-tRNA synthetase